MSKKIINGVELHQCIGPGKNGEGCNELVERRKENGEMQFICPECRKRIEYIDHNTSCVTHKFHAGLEFPKQ